MTPKNRSLFPKMIDNPNIIIALLFTFTAFFMDLNNKNFIDIMRSFEYLSNYKCY